MSCKAKSTPNNRSKRKRKNGKRGKEQMIIRGQEVKVVKEYKNFILELETTKEANSRH